MHTVSEYKAQAQTEFKALDVQAIIAMLDYIYVDVAALNISAGQAIYEAIQILSDYKSSMPLPEKDDMNQS